MKLFSFIILFGIVNDSTSDEEWIKELVFTNDIVKKASDINNRVIKGKFIANGLEHVIKTVVSNDNYYIDYISHMFVVPDTPYLDVPESIKVNWTLKKIIKKELKITATNVLNIDITNLPWTQLGDERRSLTQEALRNIITKEINGVREVPNVGKSGINELFTKLFQITVPSSSDKNKVPSVEKRGFIELFKNLFKRILPSSNDESTTFVTPSLHEVCSTSGTKTEENKSAVNEERNKDSCIIDVYDGQEDKSSIPSSSNIDIYEEQDDVKSVPPSIESPYDVTYDIPIEIMCRCIALLMNIKYRTLFIYANMDYNDKTKCKVEIRMSRAGEKEVFSFTKINGVWSQELKMLLDQK